LSVIAVKHAEGHSRSENFGTSLVHNMFLKKIYPQEGINIYGSRTMEYEGSQSVQRWKIMFLWGTSYSLLQALLL